MAIILAVAVLAVLVVPLAVLALHLAC
jgi:hypothetical protein